MRFNYAWSMICLLLVCSCFQAVVKAVETPSWGIDRIGARCVLDKDMNMTCDPGANAGQYTGQNEDVTVAIIDAMCLETRTWTVYYHTQWSYSSGTHKTYMYYYWDNNYNSRIENVNWY